MHAHSTFTIKFAGEPELIRKQIAFVKNKVEMEDRYLGGIEADDDTNEILIEETYRFVWVEDIYDLLCDVADNEKTVTFNCSGTVDCSENSGEYMDFAAIYDGKDVSLDSTDWYTIASYSDYPTYKSFCEDFSDDSDKPLYTREEYLDFFINQRAGADYADYEDFCDEFCDEDGNPTFTEEEFERMLNGPAREYYVLDNQLTMELPGAHFGNDTVD